MKSLLRFLIRYHPTILFIILEIVAFSLIAHYSSFHSAKLFGIRHNILGTFAIKYENLTNYFSLAKENKALIEENTKLYNLLPSSYFNPAAPYMADTSVNKQFQFISARVINNSTNKQYNFITLNKGKLAGIQPNMAVICNEGIVGVVKETTLNYASVISVLNREFFPSAKIKRNGYFGPVGWAGKRYDEIILKEIPIQVEVHEGDTIITSGYSDDIPEGIMIGTVKDYEIVEGIYYDIRVKLSTDFKRLSNVLVVKDLMRKERLEIEAETSHD